MKDFKKRAFRFSFGLRIFIVLMSLFLIGFALFQFPTRASKNLKSSENLFQNNALLMYSDFTFETKTDGSTLELQSVNGEFPASFLLDFHALTGKLLISSETKLELFSKTVRKEFISNELFSNLVKPQSLVAVREKTAHFAVGEVFLGFENGTILHVSANGSQTRKIKLLREKSAVGGLVVDNTSVFGGDLIGATVDGKIWRINKSGESRFLTDLNAPLKGLAIIPNNFERFGALAGKLIVGAPVQRGIFAIDENAQTIFFPLDIKPQDIDFIEKDTNLFAVATEKNKLFSLAAKHLEDRSGDLLIASAESKELYFLRFNGTNFQVSTVKINEQINQITFAPIDFEENAGGCVTSLSQTENVLQWEGEFGSFNIIAPSNCNWTAASGAAWLTVVSGQNGTGNGTVQYFVAKNGTNILRDANITVDALAHRVRQSKKDGLRCNAGADAGNQNIGAAGANGSISITGKPDCAWKAESDSSWLTLTGNIFGAGDGTVSFTAVTNFTANTRVARVSFAAGTATVTQAPNLAPTVNAGSDQTISLPNTASLKGSASDDGIGNPVTVSWSKISGDESVLFSGANNLTTTAIFSKEGVYVLRLTASDGYLTATDDVQITVNPDPIPPPPDPTTTAPPINPTVATNPFDATKFLYTGANPIQTGVAPDAIKETSVAVLRGKVEGKNGQPIPKVKITIADHPELGQTLSRADGMFDLVVNGGGELSVKYEKPGFIPVQRIEKADWQDYEAVETVVMIPHDDNVTFIDLNSSTPIQVAQSGLITDSDGTRRSRLFFKQGTTATMTLPDNSTQNLMTMNVRSSEFTVGANGAETMPADLPPLSAYTYAAAYTVDEAVALNATEVTFNQPVIQYNENFLNFPVGINVPSGALDEETGIWMPSANGRVVKTLSITSGVANLDLDGSGNPADDAAYTALGINLAERERLAALYAVNQSLWRVPVIHFSAWDSNFAFGPPSDGGPPNGGNASGGGNGPGGSGCPNGSNESNGCIIGIEDQRLSEEIDVVGTPFFLRYDSTRPRGNIANYTAQIPLSGATLPGPVTRIELKVTIAGQMHEFTFPAQPNQITSFTWDGKDAYGRTLQGQQEVTIDIGNVYNGVYQNTPNFGYNGNGVPITVNTRQEITIHRVQKLLLGSYTAPQESLGGWSLSEHHAYDPVGQKLYEGNGKQRNVQTVSNKIETFGGGLRGFFGDGGQVRDARFTDPYGVAVAPDGSVYIADSGNARIRKVTPDGIITTFAGNGGGCNPANFPCGDGGPAANASFGGVIRIAVAPDNSIYLGGGRNIWRITTDGIFRRVAGLALDGFSGDGGQARDAHISNATRFFPAADGSVYVSDMLNQRIRRIDPNGIITTIAGTGTAGFSGDGGQAINAQINNPGDIVAAPDGNVYFIDQDNHRIRKIAPDGIISTYAGTGTFGSSPDGLQALQTNFIFRAANQIESGSMSLAPDGSLYVVSYVFPSGGRIRRIRADGIVEGVAGNGQIGGQGDGGPALQSQMRLSSIGLAPDGSIYSVGGFTFDFDTASVRKISSPLPNFNGSQIAIPSDDGTRLFQFDAQGRHLSTINTLTNATVFTFNYDSMGRLTSVVDGDNNTTTIERDGSGNPTGIRSPYDQSTTFTRDANGFLATITNPNSEQYQFTYNPEGLMLTTRDPRNNLNTFTYNALGQLIRDDDPATGYQTLTRTDQGVNFTVTHNTALNRQTAFQINNLSNGDRQRINSLPDGTQTNLLERGSGVNTFTQPDGTVTTETTSGDPRWKLQAPITTNTTVATPGGLNFNLSFARTATLATLGDPLSLTTQTDTRNINGRIYTSVFTASNKTFTLTSPQNRQATTVIDSQGRLTNYLYADLNPFELSYDTRGRLSTFNEGTGGQARTFNLSYNTAGFLSSFTNPLNQTTNLVYDPAGRIKQQTLPDARNIAFAYDAEGNLTSLTPPSRPAHIFTYNAINLVSSYAAPNIGGNSTTVYEYNLDRDLTRITRPDALQINYAYDNAGRLQTLTVPNGNYGFVYSPTTGLLNSITAPDSSILAFQYDGFLQTRQTWTGTIAGNVSRTFDNNFRVASQSVNGGNTINFSYDNDNLLTGAGNLTLTRNPQNGLLSGSTLNNVTDTFTYNGFAEPTNYNAKFNTTNLYDVNYTYDKLGRITQKTETIGGVSTVFVYGYDSTGRLTTVTLNGAPQPMVIYGYDNNDNRTSIDLSGIITNASYDNQDRLTNYGATVYNYTANGELQSKTIGANTTQYSYDVIGNLRNVILPDGTQIEYLIDGQDRRIGKKINGTLTQGFLYQDQLEPVAELDASNNIVSRFVYGTRANTPDYMIKNGVIYRLITDQAGSVRLVVDAATGNIAQRIDYDEFGVVLTDTNPNFQPFGFAGGLYDTQTRLTRFGARDYDAETGRWTAKDPILSDSNQTNFYVYVFCDPINLRDSNGLQAVQGSGGFGGSNTGSSGFGGSNTGSSGFGGSNMGSGGFGGEMQIPTGNSEGNFDRNQQTPRCPIPSNNPPNNPPNNEPPTSVYPPYESPFGGSYNPPYTDSNIIVIPMSGPYY